MVEQTPNAALAELEAAHEIIKNALSLMTPKQKTEWAQKNEATGIVSEGATRASERLVVIHRLKEGLPAGATYSADDLRIAANHAIDIACLAECHTSRLAALFFTVKGLVDDTTHAHVLADLGAELASDWSVQFVDHCSQVEKLLAVQLSGGAK